MKILKKSCNLKILHLNNMLMFHVTKEVHVLMKGLLTETKEDSLMKVLKLFKR